MPTNENNSIFIILESVISLTILSVIILLLFYLIRRDSTKEGLTMKIALVLVLLMLTVYLIGVFSSSIINNQLSWLLNSLSIIVLLISFFTSSEKSINKVELQLQKKLNLNGKNSDLFLPVLSSKIHKTIFQSTSIGFMIINNEGKPVVNNVFTQNLLCYTENELSKMKFSDFTHPDDVMKDMDLFIKLNAEEIEQYEIEKRLIQKNEKICWVNLHFSKAKGESVIVILRDITEQVALEKEVSESNLQLWLINDTLITSQEKARMGSWEVDLISKKITLSKVIYEIYGVEEGTEISIEESLSFYRSDFLSVISDAFKNLVVHKKKYDLELVLISKQGKETWVRTTGYPVIKNGKTVAARGLFIDINESRQAQIKLEQKSIETIAANRKIKLAQSVLGFGIWNFDIQTNELEFDEVMHSFFENDDASDNIYHWKTLIQKEDKIKLYENIDLIKEKVGKFEMLLRYNPTDGKCKKLKTKAESFKDSNSDIHLIIGTCSDVTEEYAMVEALKNSEQTINEAQQIANFGYFDYNIIDDSLTWSNHMNIIFEPDESFEFNFMGFINLMHDDDKKFASAIIQKSIQSGGPINLKHRTILKNGEIKTVHHQAKVYLNAENKPFKIIGLTQDISKESELQYQLEVNLLHQQVITQIALLLNNPSEFAPKIDNTLKLIGNVLSLDRAFIFGNPETETSINFEWVRNENLSIKNNLEFKNLIVSESISGLFKDNQLLMINEVDNLSDDLKKVLKIRNIKNICLSRYAYDENTYIYFGLEKTNIPEAYNDSEINLMETASLMIKNVFKEKASAEKLHNSEYMFKTLVRSITDPYFVINHNFDYVYLNAPALEFIEHNTNVIGRNLSDTGVGPVNQNLMERLKNSFTEEKSIQLIEKHDDRFLELSIYSGNIGYSIISKDITERVNLQQSLEVSKQKYESLYHRTPAMMHSINEEGKIINVSKYWLEKMGYSMDEVINKRSDFFLSESSKIEAKGNFKELAKNGHLKNVSLQFLQKSGKTIETLLSANTEVDKNGKFIQTMAVITDVTSEKAAEAEINRINKNLDITVKERTLELQSLYETLSEQRDFLNTFIQNTDSIIYIKDVDGKYLLVNKQFAKLHYTENTNSLIGKSIFDLYNKDSAKKIMAVHKSVLKTGEMLTQEEKFYYNNEESSFLTTRFPLKKKNGSIYAVACICVDITKLKHQQERLTEQSEELTISNKILSKQRNLLKDQQKKLIEVNQELESFSYSVSHDLRAPLRAMEAFSKILNEKYAEKLDNSGKKWLEFISSNAIKMDKLISDILEFSRISRSQMKKKEFNTNTLVSSIIEDEKSNYPNHKFNIKTNSLINTFGDINMIKQVWINLISNAFKYSSKNDAIDVEITSRETKNQVIYEISDKGAGFNEDYAGKLFTVFQRLHNEKDFSGTGVGLAIVKKIIDKHEGTIMATSEVDNGATFTFSIQKKHETID